MEIIKSDKVNWSTLFLDHQYIVVNYQPQIDCPGCKEINDLFQKLSEQADFKSVKFLWVDSRTNPVAEMFIEKKQVPFIAAFKEGFLVECDNISNEIELRTMIQRLFTFKFKL